MDIIIISRHVPNQLSQVWQTKKHFQLAPGSENSWSQQGVSGEGGGGKEEEKHNMECKESSIISILMNFVYR